MMLRLALAAAMSPRSASRRPLEPTLTHATRTAAQETLRALIAAGANLQLADRQGRTPLALARGRGYAEMVGMLEAASARR